MADTPIEVPVGSLGFTGSDALFVNSGDCKLVFTGYAPTVVLADTIISPATRSLSFTGQAVSRKTGLFFEGYAPTVNITHIVSGGLDADNLAFTGYIPQVIVAGANSFVIVPQTGSLGFVGYEATLEASPAEPGTGSIAFTGQAIAAVNITSTAFPFFAQLAFTGQPLTIENTTPDDPGTPITNSDASFNDGKYEISDRSGFRLKPGEGVFEWDGTFVAPWEYTAKHPQLDLRGKRDKLKKGSLRPDDTGTENYLDSENTPISADDL